MAATAAVMILALMAAKAAGHAAGGMRAEPGDSHMFQLLARHGSSVTDSQSVNATMASATQVSWYTLSSDALTGGELIANYYNGQPKPELAGFTSEGGMQQTGCCLAWGLTKQAWSNLGLVDLDGSWTMRFDYSYPSTENRHYLDEFIYLQFDRPLNIGQGGSIWIAHGNDGHNRYTHSIYGNDFVILTPAGDKHTEGLLGKFDTEFNMYISHDGATGYMNVRIHEQGGSSPVVEMEVRRRVTFTNDIPVGFYFNDAHPYWRRVGLVSPALAPATPAPTASTPAPPQAQATPSPTPAQTPAPTLVPTSSPTSSPSPTGYFTPRLAAGDGATFAVDENGSLTLWGSRPGEVWDEMLVFAESQRASGIRILDLEVSATWGNLIYATYEDGSYVGAGVRARHPAWNNPELVHAGRKWKRLVPVSYQSVCGVTDEDDMLCWGYRAPASAYQGQIAGCSAMKVAGFATGYYSWCGIDKADLSLWCHKQNDYTCPWKNDNGDLPKIQPPTGTFKSVHSNNLGYDMVPTCAIRTDDTVVCFDAWDDNQNAWGVGRVITPSSTRLSEFAVPTDAVGVKFRRLSVGLEVICGVTASDSTLKCWGDDASLAVSGAPDGQVADVSCGEHHCCAILADQVSMTCWGAAPAVPDGFKLAPSPAPALAAPPSAGGAGSGASAVGDPHLQNVHGERFDLMRAGKHVLINIPRGMSAENALLRVQADARRLGGHCADMYFQELNVTGSWAEAKQVGGYHYSASQREAKSPPWVAFGKVELKVVHGRTDSGLLYLNLYVKHLRRAGFAVGGLLGEDDHEHVSIAPDACAQRLAL